MRHRFARFATKDTGNFLPRPIWCIRWPFLAPSCNCPSRCEGSIVERDAVVKIWQLLVLSAEATTWTLRELAWKAGISWNLMYCRWYRRHSSYRVFTQYDSLVHKLKRECTCVMIWATVHTSNMQKEAKFKYISLIKRPKWYVSMQRMTHSLI